MTTTEIGGNDVSTSAGSIPPTNGATDGATTTTEAPKDKKLRRTDEERDAASLKFTAAELVVVRREQAKLKELCGLDVSLADTARSMMRKYIAQLSAEHARSGA
jgi:hypothetical protein